MSNGNMKVVNNRIVGEVRTYALNLSFYLEKNTRAVSEKAPQYLVMARAPAGHNFQAGVVWEKTISKGRSLGLLMYQLTLDDPAFGDNPIYLNAFPTLSGEWEVSVERKRQAGATVEQGEVANGAGIPGDFGGDQVAAVG